MSKQSTESYLTIQEDGKPKCVRESVFDALWEGDETNKPEVFRRQTFAIHEAEAIDEFLELAPTESVTVDLWNRGAKLKQLAAIRELMQSPLEGEASFIPVDGVYDLRDVISRPAEPRRKMTPLERAIRDIGKLGAEDKQRFIAALLGAQASEASA